MSQLRIKPTHSVNNLGKLKDLVKSSNIELPKHEQPAPIVFEGPVNTWYSSTRNSKTTKVWLVEVRKDTVIFKDQPTDKHSQSLSLAKFVKFYKQV